jgi:hypothetical protein
LIPRREERPAVPPACDLGGQRGATAQPHPIFAPLRTAIKPDEDMGGSHKRGSSGILLSAF